MKKSIITLAVASAAAMGSVAQADNTTLYGRVAMAFTYNSENVQEINEAGDEVVSVSHTKSNVGNSGSRFGIKGSDDIGGGLTAFYKYENRIKANLATNKLYVGLKGGFGSVSIGKQSLPIDGLSNNTDPFNSTSVGNRMVGMDKTVIVEDEVSKQYVKDTFKTRIGTSAANSIVYKTPEMSGFTASAAMVVDRDNATESEVDMYNVAVEYAANGIYAGLSYAATAEKADAKDSVVSLGLGYKSGSAAGDFNVGLLVEQYEIEVKDSDTTKGTYARIGGAYNITEMDSVYASFDQLDIQDANKPTGASLGYTHKLSNRTKVWAEYGYQDNDMGKDSDSSTVSLGLRTDF